MRVDVEWGRFAVVVFDEDEHWTMPERLYDRSEYPKGHTVSFLTGYWAQAYEESFCSNWEGPFDSPIEAEKFVRCDYDTDPEYDAELAAERDGQSADGAGKED